MAPGIHATPEDIDGLRSELRLLVDLSLDDIDDRMTAQRTALEAAIAETSGRVTTLGGEVSRLWDAVNALQPAPPPAPAPPPIAPRLTMAYYLPSARFGEAKARGVDVGHVTAPNLGYLSAAKAAGMLVDYEMQAHTTGGLDTPAEVSAALSAAKAGGYADTIRRVLMIDEPDAYPTGSWDMAKFRAMYSAVKAVHPWPVWVLVRADGTSYPKCVPWFDPTISDGIAWDPYLAFYKQYAESWITTEAKRLRTGMGPDKPLTCVLQAGYIGWAQDLPSFPATRPTADKVRSMGVAALQAGANDCQLWLENDWTWMVQPTGNTWRTDVSVALRDIPPVWNGIKVATDAWKAA